MKNKSKSSHSVRIRDNKENLEFRPNELGDLHNLLMQAPMAVGILIGPDHQYAFSNHLTNKILKVENPIGKTVKELFPHNKEILAMLDQTYKTGKPFNVAEFPINLEGEGNYSKTIYINATYQPLFDKNNTVMGIMTTGFEITEQVKARKGLELIAQERENERRRLEFGQIAGKIGTYEWDLIANKSVWTKEFEALYGYSNGGFKADNTKAWLKLLHPEDRERVMKETDKALKNSDELSLEYRAVWPDNTMHYLANRAQIVRNPSGKVIQLNGVNIDITERKIIENNLTFLSEASMILSSSLDYKTTLANVTKLAVPEIADWCSVTMKNGDELEEISIAHIDPKKIKWAKELRKINPPDPYAKTGLANVLRTGKSELYSNITDEMLMATARNSDELELLRKLQLKSVMIVPFLIEGNAIGAITFIGAESGRKYTKSDLAMAEEVASRMAMAIENARLYSDAKNADNRQKFLAEASALLASTINLEATLKNLGALIVPSLADYCRIVLVDSKREIKEITINHIDPKMLPYVRQLYDAYKDTNSTSGVGRLISTGKSELMSKLTPEILKTANPETLKLIKKLQLQSYMGVPMKIGDRIVGAITFSSTNKNRIFTNVDVMFAEELARRAALAIENSRLFEESQKAVALRDEFISVASHELKTPVTSLKMYIHAIKKQQSERGEDTRNLDKMDAQVNKLTFLIQDLLNVSKFQSGKLEYHDLEFDLHDVVDEVIDNLQSTTSKHLVSVDGTLKRTVWGDKDRIGQVLTNLLTNAIKYSPQADKIIVRLKPKKESAEVIVQDFGIGIEKEHLDKLFDRFYRVAEPEEKTFPGMGLGLYISSEIVKRYGGNMKVESEKGKGSKFSFSLPYAHYEQ